jgi:hypothetical protein
MGLSTPLNGDVVSPSVLSNSEYQPIIFHILDIWGSIPGVSYLENLWVYIAVTCGRIPQTRMCQSCPHSIITIPRRARLLLQFTFKKLRLMNAFSQSRCTSHGTHLISPSKNRRISYFVKSINCDSLNNLSRPPFYLLPPRSKRSPRCPLLIKSLIFCDVVPCGSCEN